MIKAVFLDIDNTLTSPVTRRIPESARVAIRRARAKGIKVFICTGRNTRTPEESEVLEDEVFDGYAAVNGQMCYLPDGTVIHTLPLAREDVIAVRDFCREKNISLLVAERDRNYISHIDAVADAVIRMLKVEPFAVDSVDALEEREILALSPFASDDACEAALRAILKHSNTVRFNNLNFDVIPDNGGKDVGMRILLDHFGIDAADCLAIGDGDNDIAMLQLAGIGVAMGGSEAAVQAAADDVAPTPDEDGIYKTFEKYGLL